MLKQDTSKSKQDLVKTRRTNEKHPSTWMFLVSAHVDNEIFEAVMLMNILGYQTVFSCQSIRKTNCVQLMLKRKCVSNFRCFLSEYSIKNRETASLSGVEFLFSDKAFLKLMSALLNHADPI